MSRKHFNDLAGRLKGMRPSGANQYATAWGKHLAVGRLEQWGDMVRGMADFCQSQSNLFDRERFLAAVGLND